MGHDHSHHHHHHFELPSHDVPHGKLLRLATYASVSVALLLLIAKLVAWWRTDSLSMLSSLTDSLFDVLTSVLNMVALRYALKPADEEHRFGHTSIEDIAGLAQAAFIAASMVIIILQSVERLANPQVMTHEALGMGVSVFAMIATTVLVAFQTYVARKTRSLIIAADRLHYAGDILFNLGVLAALFASARYGFTWADPAMAITIAIAILYSTWPLAQRAFNNLMDREMPDDEKARIASIVSSTSGVLRMTNLKTRYSGSKPFMQMHIDVDASLPLSDVHAITDKLEEALFAAFPGAEVIIHPEPVAQG